MPMKALVLSLFTSVYTIACSNTEQNISEKKKKNSKKEPMFQRKAERELYEQMLIIKKDYKKPETVYFFIFSII